VVREKGGRADKVNLMWSLQFLRRTVNQ